MSAAPIFRRPRVLMAHCYYRQRGGEDVSFESELALLRDHGHTVRAFTRHNTSIEADRPWDKARLAARTISSRRTAAALAAELVQVRPDVAHFQNTFPLISPSAYAVCRRAGVPVVQTLHNYRLRCVKAVLYRDGAVCEDCVGRRLAWPGVMHGCYQGSPARSAVIASMLVVHWTASTWDNVDVFVALSNFARRKFIEFGLPADKVVVKPNFVYPDPGNRPDHEVGDFLLFVGRLDEGKGIHTLLAAMEELPISLQLVIVGDGPLRQEAARHAHLAGMTNVRFVGEQSQEHVYALMRRARAVVAPSEWYETFGRVVAEAYACGTPAVVTSLGAIGELVDPGVTGLHVKPGEAESLAATLSWVWSHPEKMRRMGRAARAQFERLYSAERNYGQTMELYRQALASHRG